MLEFIAGFDILGVGALIGSLLFLGLLVRFIVDDRPLGDREVGPGSSKDEDGHPGNPTPSRRAA